MYWQKRFDRENPDKQLEDEITKIHSREINHRYLVKLSVILILKAFTRHHTHKSNMKFEDANVVENHCY